MFLSKRIKIWIAVSLIPAMLISPGCSWFRSEKDRAYREVDFELYKDTATAIEYPDVESACFDEVASTGRPRTLINREPTEYWNVSLEECIHIALTNSKVLRDLGGAVLDAPDAVQTVYDPARNEADPRFGVEAALSAFDAEWSTQAFFEKNDRAVNNQFFGGGTRLFKQDLLDYTSELSKQTATGANLAVRHNVQYDFNNAPGNATPNLPWGTNFEVEVRQPILQGAGVRFNRIAGPNATPGVYNGVLIARIRTDIALADFQDSVTNLVFSVEYLYWELYAAYRRLDAKIAARDRALETWRIVNSLKDQVGADEEAQAREQYYRLENDVQNALNGQLQEKADITAFRGTAGVHVNERRLRLLMGLPINDGRLIRPKNEPVMAKIVFDWNEALVEALMRRTVLRRQKWRIKQRELELVASKNFLRPRLDTIGRYRWRGLGHDLITDNLASRFDSAFGNLQTGDFQEWQLGFELSFNAGARQAHAAIRNAELNLARDHAVLHEQEREVTHDLSNAIGELERAYTSAKLNYNRRLAAKQQLAALEAKARGDLRTQTRYLDLILDAQRRLADAETLYYNSLAEYMLAIRLVHRAKGSLLDYNEIHLAEGPWPAEAYRDAARRERLRVRSWHLENFLLDSPPISRGPTPQDVDSTDAQPLPAEIIPTPDEESSPLPPAPPAVAPRSDGGLYESANNESTRRTLDDRADPKETNFASNKRVTAAEQVFASTKLEIEKRSIDAAFREQQGPDRIENSLPLTEIFKIRSPGLQPSVLSGTLLEPPLVGHGNWQPRHGPVIRLATDRPVDEGTPDAQRAGGHAQPKGEKPVRQVRFDASATQTRVAPHQSSAPGPPRVSKQPRMGMPTSVPNQTRRPRRTNMPFPEAPSSRSAAPFQPGNPQAGFERRRTKPVVRYFEPQTQSAWNNQQPTKPVVPTNAERGQSRGNIVSLVPGPPKTSAMPSAQTQKPNVKARSAAPKAPFQYPRTPARAYAPAPVVEHVPSP